MKKTMLFVQGLLVLTLLATSAPAQPTDVDRLVASGSEYYRNGMYDKAMRDYRAAFNKDRDNLDAARGLGNSALQVRDWRNAKLGLEAAHKQAPEDCATTKSLAYVYMALKLYDRATGAYESIIGKSGRAGCEPGDNFSKINLASLYMRSKNNADRDRALPLIIQVIQNETEDKGLLARAHGYAGTIYRQKKNNDLAIEHMEKVFEYDPERVEGHDKLGQLYFNKGEYDQALAHLELAYEQEPNSYNTNLMLGLCYESMTRHEEDALNHFRKAVNLIKAMPADKRPSKNLPHRYLAKLLNDMGESREAIEISDEGLELAAEGSEHAGLICTKAKGLEKLGKYEDALELFETVENDAVWGKYATKQVSRQENLIARAEAQAQQ